jgi:hypothetical protein
MWYTGAEMRNSNWDAARCKLEEPFPSPTRFGRPQWWFDESRSALMLAVVISAAIVTLILAIALLRLRMMPADQGKPGNPEVTVEQVMLGGATGIPSDLDDLPDTTQNTMIAQRDAQRPVADIKQVDTPQVSGNLPTPNARQMTSSAVRKQVGLASQELATALDKLTRPQIAGFQGLSGLFKVDPSVKSIVYVLDKSSSMGGLPISSVKAELIHGIRALKEDQKFGVIFFDFSAWPTMAGQGQVVTAQLQVGGFALMQATRENQQNAERWIQSIGAGGGTNPVPAMAMAIHVKPEMIMLLSDGEFAPSAVDIITQQNQKERGASGRIDCVGLAENIVTLQEIAKQNAGRYYAARIGP